jgi:hypothetical protein
MSSKRSRSRSEEKRGEKQEQKQKPVPPTVMRTPYIVAEVCLK